MGEHTISATAEATATDRLPGVPEGYATVCPWIITHDTNRVIEFAKAAFDAEEMGRVVDEDGVIGHAEFRIGDSVVLAFDSRPHWPVTPAFLRLYVADADATFERAVAAGAEPVTLIEPTPWGDRAGRVRDPLGNLWWIMSRVEDVDEAEMARRWMLPEYVAAMERATSFDPFPANA